MTEPRRIAVIGAGAWGTSLASVLAERYGEVSLWVYETDLAVEIARTRENACYLPGVRLAEAIRPTSSLEEALAGCDLAVLVVPSHVFRGIVERVRHHLDPAALVVSATKGIEVESLCTMFQILEAILP